MTIGFRLNHDHHPWMKARKMRDFKVRFTLFAPHIIWHPCLCPSWFIFAYTNGQQCWPLVQTEMCWLNTSLAVWTPERGQRGRVGYTRTHGLWNAISIGECKPWKARTRRCSHCWPFIYFSSHIQSTLFLPLKHLSCILQKPGRFIAWCHNYLASSSCDPNSPLTAVNFWLQ